MSAKMEATRPWHCRVCGMFRRGAGGELHIKYKEAHYFVRGRCRHACRRCGAANAVVTPELAAPPGPSRSERDRR